MKSSFHPCLNVLNRTVFRRERWRKSWHCSPRCFGTSHFFGWTLHNTRVLFLLQQVVLKFMPHNFLRILCFLYLKRIIRAECESICLFLLREQLIGLAKTFVLRFTSFAANKNCLSLMKIELNWNETGYSETAASAGTLFMKNRDFINLYSWCSSIHRCNNIQWNIRKEMSFCITAIF